jgi:hypothetical protein
MTTHSPSIDCFCEELRADPQLSKFADQFHSGLTEIDRLADDSPDHAEIFFGLEFIFGRQSRPIAERVAKMAELLKLEGHPVIVDLKAFTGWR